MAKYTPAPWQVDSLRPDLVVNVDGHTIAEIQEDITAWRIDSADTVEEADALRVNEEDEAEANARLIAQAPALEEAVEEALTWWHSDSRNFGRVEPGWLEKARQARTAIKAE